MSLTGLTLLSILLGIGVGVANLVLSAVISLIVSVLTPWTDNPWFFDHNKEQLHIGDAGFLAFELGILGCCVYILESGLLHLGFVRNTIIASSSTFGILLILIFAKASGLLKRVCPSLAGALDSLREKVLDMVRF